MPQHTIDLIVDAFNEAGKSITNSTVTILGISYKPDVKDIQLTPAEPIIKNLKNLNAKVRIYDPYFKKTDVFGLKTEDDFISAITDSDAIILITSHKEFHDLEPTFLSSKLRSGIVIDSRCIIDQYDAKKAGLIYRGIGRGKI